MQDKVEGMTSQPVQVEALPTLASPVTDVPLVDIGIEKALSFMGQVSNEQFINDV